MVGQAFSFDGTNGYIQTTLDDATLPTRGLIDPNADVFTNNQAQRF
jgi:hypothetical protein